MKETSPKPSESDGAKTVSVMLVEDERELRESLVRMVNAFPGFTCTSVCASGEEALRQFPLQHPRVVLMDIFLPRMSGIECTSRLKAAWPETLILILTAVADDEMVFLALQAGADGYLLKSTRPAELLVALNELLGGGAPMTSAVARRVVRYFRQRPKRPSEDVNLSAREEEVLVLLSKGYSNKEIAAQLTLSIDTVASYLKQIYKKMHVRSRTEAAMRYSQLKVN